MRSERLRTRRSTERKAPDEAHESHERDLRRWRLAGRRANKREIWALHARVLARGQRPVVPAGVLGQAWRGGPQAELSRLLRGCRVEDLTEQRSRAAGVACARSGARDVIGASVVVGALARDALVVTSDPHDLARIADGLGRELRMHRI